MRVNQYLNKIFKIMKNYSLSFKVFAVMLCVFSFFIVNGQILNKEYLCKYQDILSFSDNKPPYGSKNLLEFNISETPVYLHPSAPIDLRVEDLLSRMTLEEKIGQMNMPCMYIYELGRTIEEKKEACKKFTEGVYEPGIGPGGGFFTLANEALQQGTFEQATYFNELQKIATEKTRLGIPLFQIEEGTHGLMCTDGTIFPEGLGLGSTWNMKLFEKIYSIVAEEARSTGIHALFTLCIEPNRDPRMGRNMEGYAECPFLCSSIAESIVKAVQGDDISRPDKAIAGLAHYPGQSEGLSGQERAAMDLSEREFRTTFLPPWIAGIKKAGALGVMATYPAINGLPAHASEKILTDILRNELGFKGLVLGEGHGISTIVLEHIVETQKEAGILTLNAGLDVGISYEDAFMHALAEAVKEEKVDIKVLDRAVSRILRIKFELGLFENPYVDPEHAVKVRHTPASQEVALQAARESIVLLKNEKNLLPLSKNIRSIAVIGPNANHERNQLGDYLPHVIPQKITTILEGIQQKVSSRTKITYVKGCDVMPGDYDEIQKAVKAARNSDIAVVVVGENERYAENSKGEDIGTNGEGRDIANLDLTGRQEELIKAVHATGTPVIVVLINGRPLSIRWTAENVPAILEAWIPGEKGGEAVAEVIFGDYNPGGKLPITIPRHSGQLPAYYNHPSRRQWSRNYVDMPSTPLYEFGYGLSYTTFEYSNLQFSKNKIGVAGYIEIEVDIKNTGKRAGSEVVQLYLNDVISSLTTPQKELRGFEKVFLEPEEIKTVKFIIGPEEMSFINTDMKPVVEPGVFEVMIGSSSADIRLKGSFEVVK